MLILGLGHNSWRDPNVNTDEEDYNEELEELNEKYGRYEETFLHRYHVTDPPGRKSLNYFDFDNYDDVRASSSSFLTPKIRASVERNYFIYLTF